MKTVDRSELLELGAYEELREPFRHRMIELKKVRRVAIGSNMTAVFENHDTVLFQIQEMLRTERITRPDGIQHELDTYNALIPAEGELSATVFIEYPNPEERERMLEALDGVERTFYVTVGEKRCPGRSETRGVSPGRTTAVHYVTFPVGTVGIESIREGDTVRVGVDHPNYQAETELTKDAVHELRVDLGG
jgi:hypothetical protein